MAPKINLAAPRTLAERVGLPEVSQRGTNHGVVVKYLYHMRDATLRVRIYSESYRFQMYAKVEIWDHSKSKWNELWSIEPGAMKTKECLGAFPEARTKGDPWFLLQVEDDLRILLDRARDILGYL